MGRGRRRRGPLPRIADRGAAHAGACRGTLPPDERQGHLRRAERTDLFLPASQHRRIRPAAGDFPAALHRFFARQPFDLGRDGPWRPGLCRCRGPHRDRRARREVQSAAAAPDERGLGAGLHGRGACSMSGRFIRGSTASTNAVRRSASCRRLRRSAACSRTAAAICGSAPAARGSTVSTPGAACGVSSTIPGTPRGWLTTTCAASARTTRAGCGSA